MSANIRPCYTPARRKPRRPGGNNTSTRSRLATRMTMGPLENSGRMRDPTSLCYAFGKMDEKNKLYFGDDLKTLRDYVEHASVDLIYLDPPFNSSATYNVLFKEKSGHHPLVPSSERRGVRCSSPLLTKEGKQGWLATVGPGARSCLQGNRDQQAAQARRPDAVAADVLGERQYGR